MRGNTETLKWFCLYHEGNRAIGDDNHLPFPIISNIHANDSVELEGMLPRVTPDCSGIRVPCILGQILQTHASPTQECQAGTSTSMAGDLACSILLIDASSRAERRNQGFVDETRSDTQVLVTEEVVNLLTLLGVKEFSLILWAFSLPCIDGSSDVVGNPDPERASY